MRVRRSFSTSRRVDRAADLGRKKITTVHVRHVKIARRGRRHDGRWKKRAVDGGVGERRRERSKYGADSGGSTLSFGTRYRGLDSGRRGDERERVSHFIGAARCGSTFVERAAMAMAMAKAVAATRQRNARLDFDRAARDEWTTRVPRAYRIRLVRSTTST